MGSRRYNPGEKVVLTISDFSVDVPESVPPGAAVTVVNEDGAPHTVTADDGTFDSAAGEGESGTCTAPGEPGEFPFHCSAHPDMTGTLVVA